MTLWHKAAPGKNGLPRATRVINFSQIAAPVGEELHEHASFLRNERCQLLLTDTAARRGTGGERGSREPRVYWLPGASEFLPHIAPRIECFGAASNDTIRPFFA